MLKGFKKFISQGNVIDLAVAVIIGNAFKPIVDKVTETIMGIIGQVICSPNFDSVGKFSLLSNPQGDADYIYPGAILTQVINFLLIAAAVYFCIVLPMNKFKERMKKSEAEAPPSPPTSSSSPRSATCSPRRSSAERRGREGATGGAAVPGVPDPGITAILPFMVPAGHRGRRAPSHRHRIESFWTAVQGRGSACRRRRGRMRSPTAVSTAPSVCASPALRRSRCPGCAGAR